MNKLINILIKAGIKFTVLFVIYIFLDRPGILRRYESALLIICAVIAVKFLFDIYLDYSAMRREEQMLKEAKLRKSGKMVGKKHAVPQKVVNPSVLSPVAANPTVSNISEGEKKIGRWLSLPDGRKLYEFDGHFVKDSKGLVLYEWDGKYFTTGLGEKLYELDGNWIKQVYGSRLYEYDGKVVKKNDGYTEYLWDGATIKQNKGRLHYLWDGTDFPIVMVIVVLITDMHLKG